MELLEIFPHPILIEEYEDKEKLNNMLLDELSNNIGEKNDASPKLFHYLNNPNSSVLENKKFEDFKIWCENLCTEFVSNILGYDLEDRMIVTDSWLNKCNSGGFQYPHMHTNSFISGTYYINFEEGHSPLTFNKRDTSPFSNRQVLSLKKSNQTTKYNSNFTLKPNVGELVLWESNLCHGHFNNMKDNRVSLSMNFMPSIISSGKYGFKIVPQL